MWYYRMYLHQCYLDVIYVFTLYYINKFVSPGKWNSVFQGHLLAKFLSHYDTDKWLSRLCLLWNSGMKSIYWKWFILGNSACWEHHSIIIEMSGKVKITRSQLKYLYKMQLSTGQQWYSWTLLYPSHHINISIIRAPSQYKDRLIYVWRFPC